MRWSVLLLRAFKLSPKGERPVFEKYGFMHGARILSGHVSSWSGARTLRKWYPNLHVRSIPSEILQRNIVTVVSEAASREINRMGLDDYVLNGFSDPDTRPLFAKSEFAVNLYRELVAKKAENEAMAEVETQAQHLASWIEEQASKGKYIPLYYETNLGVVMNEDASKRLDFVSKLSRQASTSSVSTEPTPPSKPLTTIVLPPFEDHPSQLADLKGPTWRQKTQRGSTKKSEKRDEALANQILKTGQPAVAAKRKGIALVTSIQPSVGLFKAASSQTTSGAPATSASAAASKQQPPPPPLKSEEKKAAAPVEEKKAESAADGTQPKDGADSAAQAPSASAPPSGKKKAKRPVKGQRKAAAASASGQADSTSSDSSK